MKSLFGRINKAIANTINSFSITSKVVFTISVVIFIFSGFILLNNFNQKFLIEIPKSTSSLTIGLIGAPRTLNPVLAETESGKSINNLIYSGLMKKDNDGNIIPDLAQSYTISPDGKSVSFKLIENAIFHDKTPITTADIAFTISKIQDPIIKSPRRSFWESIKITLVSDKEITFTSDKPIAQNMRELTVGILPSHVWKDISNDQFLASSYNIQPIGSGPYMVDSVHFAKNGLISKYVLKSFAKHHEKEPYIKSLKINIYQNENEALKDLQTNRLDILGAIPPILASQLETQKNIAHRKLPRIFALFFNTSQATILNDVNIRKALNITAPRQEIIEKVFYGHADIINGPLPSFMYEYNTEISTSSIIEANRILDKAGWVLNENGIRTKKIGNDTVSLAFSIATSDVSDLKNTATLLQEAWKKIGVNIKIDIYESGDLNQNIIRERRYDSLLFGQIISQESDLYAFWHSSQRKDPGLNISLYTSQQVDKTLENMRVSSSTNLSNLYRPLLAEFEKDIPAIFLYSPLYIEILPDGMKDYSLSPLRDTSERFFESTKWYIRTQKIWPIFNKQK